MRHPARPTNDLYIQGGEAGLGTPIGATLSRHSIGLLLIDRDRTAQNISFRVASAAGSRFGEGGGQWFHGIRRRRRRRRSSTLQYTITNCCYTCTHFLLWILIFSSFRLEFHFYFKHADTQPNSNSEQLIYRYTASTSFQGPTNTNTNNHQP